MIDQIKTYVQSNRRRSMAIGALVLVFFVWVLRHNSNSIKFEEATVEYIPTFEDQAHCVARPKPLAETYLSVQRGGRLEEVKHLAGAAVKSGDIIAVVDRTANAAALKSALSAYRLASSDYGRSSSLLQQGSATREESDSNHSKLEVKRAELEQAKQRVEDGIVRSPIDGVVSVVVFKVGDKVPDGGRIAAVVDPNGTQATCRLPAEVAVQLTREQSNTWTLVDGKTPTSWTVASKISVEDPQGGFTGLDREVRIETYDPSVRAAAGMLTDITLKLNAYTNVARLPSLAAVRRQGGTFVLQKDGSGFRWNKINVIKQSTKEVVATGVPTDGKIVVLLEELGAIETYVSKHAAK